MKLTIFKGLLHDFAHYLSFEIWHGYWKDLDKDVVTDAILEKNSFDKMCLAFFKEKLPEKFDFKRVKSLVVRVHRTMTTLNIKAVVKVDDKDIERIVLFGSVARDMATKESDVDIFIEVRKKTKRFVREINEIKEKFYKSREATLFKIKSIQNEFNIKIGDLKDWPDLEKSIMSIGIVLYGKYETRKLPRKVNNEIIIYWEGISKNRGAFLNKLYGFKVKEKYYRGILDKYNGRKLGRSCIMIPVKYKEKIFELIKYHKVKAKNLEVFI